MARTKRLFYNGGIFHVINRGNRHQSIFLNEEDYEIFLSLFSQYHEPYDFKVISYCLMTNHFHFLIEMGSVSLSLIMKKILSEYASGFNVRHQYDGHLFQGRFSAYEVISNQYLLAANKYIHLNPVKAHMVETPDKYRYSSFNAFIRKEECPDFLYPQKVMCHFNNKPLAYKWFITSAEISDIDIIVEADAKSE